MSLLRQVLKIAAPIPRVEEFRRYLFIGPHPDDIEIGAGATAARLCAMGKEVCFLICLDGRFGDGATPLRGDALAERRREEALASAKKLGVTDVRFLNLSDGGFYEQRALFDSMAKVVGEWKPEMIFAPDPCVSSECHADHLNVGEAARRLACFAPYPGIMAGHGAESAPVKAIGYYFTARPNRFVGTEMYLEKQLDAIFSCHTSQFPEDCEDGRSIALYLKLRSVAFGLRSLKGRAEGFRVLGVTQMHCFPEAGD